MKPTWAGGLVVVAAVQRGHAHLVAVAGPVGAVGPPASADTRGLPARAAQTLVPAARQTPRGQEDTHPEANQGGRAAAHPDWHPAAPGVHLSRVRAESEG